MTHSLLFSDMRPTLSPLLTPAARRADTQRADVSRSSPYDRVQYPLPLCIERAGTASLLTEALHHLADGMHVA